ncbi:outer membrane beta-barrel protein [Helicobacter sp. 13S00477-4]|uniref:outer membrane beta-barrel protein n=1 Tax=Helicobacter sp. 13S00477-4 TaxID=1905759 RepID=UPI000BA60A7B|nr:outer membrane beta-barrel protein [Helicobacter sp. 13S00477-4]PAF51647.1 hypothetical protein BKH44_05390 [Helicobacter sp. 13S00477-4]
MKKVFVLCFLLFSALQADKSQENKIFIGVSLGAGDIVKIVDDKKDLSNSYKAFIWGMKGGYEFMPSSYVGLRTYLDYFMSIKPSGLDTVTSSLLSLNLDLLADILHIKDNTFGFFGGIGFGYFQHANVVKTTPEDKATVMGYTGILNFGLGGKIQNNHRIEIGAKIPFKAIKSVNNPHIFYKDSYLFASYSYLF